MRTFPLFQRDRRVFIFGISNAFLAIVLTVVSFRYVRPTDCYRFCGPLDGTPCPPGACRFGEQKAGWPLPVFVDYPGGGSPVGGWGMLGPEDLPHPGTLLLDVLFYNLLLWLALYLIQRVRRQAFPLKPVMAMLPLNFVLAASLWFFYAIFGSYVPIGRGYGGQAYMDTPADTFTVEAFSPIVSVPVEELVEHYGAPDDLWLLPGGTSKMPSTRMVLYWDSIGMFVVLPQIANSTYAVKKTTGVEKIIFFNEEPVVGIDGQPLGEKKIPWEGYGNYRP